MQAEEQNSSTSRPARPTLVDVAKRSGFALRTTKKVMGGKEYVPETTKQAVLAAAAELGYRKNTIASALALSRTERVALVYAKLTKGYFPEVEAGFRRFADEHFDHGFEVEFSAASDVYKRQVFCLRFRFRGRAGFCPQRNCSRPDYFRRSHPTA